MSSARRSSAALRAKIQQQIDHVLATGGTRGFPHWFTNEHNVLLIHGSEAMLFWFVSPEGEVFSTDYASACPALELETDEATRRAALEAGAQTLPELGELIGR